jgi:hypothetical protein
MVGPGNATRLAVAVLLLVSVGPAAAQEGSAEAKKTARKLLASGDHKLEKGDKLAEHLQKTEARGQWEDALADYQAAYRAYPAAQIFFPIAQAEQRLERNLDAFRHYQQVLAQSEVPEELRLRVQEQAELLKTKISALRFAVDPKNATLELDGRPIPAQDVSGPLYVEPGKHHYIARAKGYRSRRRELDLQPGRQLEESVSLELIVVAPPPPPVSSPPPEEPSAAPLWAGAGTAAALAVGAIVTGGLALSEHHVSEDQNQPLDTRNAAHDRSQVLAITSYALTAGTVVAAGFTAYYYFAVYRPGRDAAASEAVDAHGSMWVSPYGDPHGMGLAIGGRF